MLKTIARLEFVVMDRIYHFVCDNDSPIDHIKEALFQCQKYVGALEDQIKEQLAQKSADEAIVDPVSEVPPEVIPDGN